jgi:hypothetical protein
MYRCKLSVHDLYFTSYLSFYDHIVLHYPEPSILVGTPLSGCAKPVWNFLCHLEWFCNSPADQRENSNRKTFRCFCKGENTRCSPLVGRS